LCLGIRGKEIKRKDKNWGKWRGKKSIFVGMGDKRGKEQPHTRFHEHLASLEPFLLQSAMGTQVYQIENDPEESKGNSHCSH
jgi:hypothetical protein